MSLPAPYYKDDSITVFNADWRDYAEDLPSVDLLLIDPPYGIGEAAGKNKSRTNLGIAKDYGNDDWDNETPTDAEILTLRCKAKHQIIFGGNYFPLPATSCWLVWDKENGGNDFADAELAWTNLKKAVRLLKWRWAGMLQEDMKNKEIRCHPTQKPLAVIKWCITQAPSDVITILDTYAGSLTTGVAAKALGRKAILFEREEKYCEAGVLRLCQEVLL